jgi:hypothetical protein
MKKTTFKETEATYEDKLAMIMPWAMPRSRKRRELWKNAAATLIVP